MRARATRAALVAVIALIGLVAWPGTASAKFWIAPELDCVAQNADGTRMLVVGYTNYFKDSRDVPLGSKNALNPSRLQGGQPTTFEAGTVRGAFTVTVTEAELRAGAGWALDGYWMDFRRAIASAPTCPASTELPEEGNGTGPAIGLAAAGVVGAVLVHRANRRARALAAASRGDA